jgi:hypothetical protein
MEPFSDTSEKKNHPSKSAEEWVRLLLKLNAKLREKLNRSKKKESAPPQTDVVIIIMTNRKETSRPEKFPPAVKSSPALRDWMEDLFAEIEGSPLKKRKTS